MTPTADERARVAQFLKNRKALLTTFEPGNVRRRTPGQLIAATPSQQQMWLHGELARAPLYNEPVTIEFRGELKVSALECAFNAFVARHEAWRTSFEWREGKLMQRVGPQLLVDLPATDLRSLPVSEREEEARRLALVDCQLPFELDRLPLFRTRLFQLEDERFALFLTLHHIIFDGVSLYRVFMPEIAALYSGFASGVGANLPAVQRQFADCALAADVRAVQMHERCLEYWSSIFAKPAPPMALPFDFPRPDVRSYAGTMHVFTVPEPTAQALKNLAHRQSVTLFTAALAAFHVLLYTFTGARDQSVGTATSSRKDEVDQHAVGFLLNTAVLRSLISPDQRFDQLLRQVRETVLGALTHDDVSYGELVQLFDKHRMAGVNPLFQVMFSLQPPLSPLPPEWRFSQSDIQIGLSKYDLHLEMDDQADRLAGRFIYSTELFHVATIEKWTARWLKLLDLASRNPEVTVAQLAAECTGRQQVNATPRAEEHPCVHEVFESCVALNPNAIAIKTPERSWTYAETDAFANRVANGLLRRGILRGQLVAIAAERSPEMIAALFGILKTGAAYVPLDANYPEERLRFMLADTCARFLIADEAGAARLAESIPADGELIELSSFAKQSAERVTCATQPDDLLCILYTSGSTGTPKGVMIEHRAVTRLVINPNYVNLNPRSVLIHLAPLSFDVSLFEIFGPLLNGARLILVSHSVSDLARVAESVEEFQVTILWLTAGLFTAMVDACPRFACTLRYLLVGGDVVSVPHARKVMQVLPHESELLDCYGPTENTTFSTYHRVRPEDLEGAAIPVGRPITGGNVYILDENRRPVGAREQGEIYVTGSGLARGYWNRPDLTAERFIEIETPSGHRERAYQTGDLGCYRTDGAIEFLGRIDSQVKIRGFRIEPSEIEVAAAAHASVAECVVIPVQRAESGDKNLRLCYVPRSGEHVPAAELEQFLRNKLPAHLVPNEYQALPVLPLDPNGKTDRKRLTAMRVLGSQASEPTADLTPMQSELLAMCRELLGNSTIGVDDDFFLVGGHSLAAARLFAKIEARFNTRLPLVMMLEVRTMRRLAQAVAKPDDAAIWSSLVPLRAEGSLTPVFLVHAISGDLIEYRDLANRLPDNVPVYGLQAQGLDGVTEVPGTVEEMAAKYIAQIRTVQAQGPYHLCGFSAGGVIAFEMARQLRQAGERVGLVGLFDTTLLYSGDWLRDIARGKGIWRAIPYALNFVIWKWWLTRQGGVGAWMRSKVQRVRAKLDFPRSERQPGQVEGVIEPSVKDAFLLALDKYKPRPMNVCCILFRTRDSARYNRSQTRTWRELTGPKLQVCTVPGDHFTMLKSPNVDLLAVELSEALNRAGLPVAVSPGGERAVVQNTAREYAGSHS